MRIKMFSCNYLLKTVIVYRRSMGECLRVCFVRGVISDSIEYPALCVAVLCGALCAHCVRSPLYVRDYVSLK